MLYVVAHFTFLGIHLARKLICILSESYRKLVLLLEIIMRPRLLGALLLK